jgi:ankyrin repeat protein
MDDRRIASLTTSSIVLAMGIGASLSFAFSENAMASQAQNIDTGVALDLSAHFDGKPRELAAAAAAGDTASVTRLIRQEHVDPNVLSKQGMPLLLWPVLKGNRAGVTALLDNGANPNIRESRGDSAMVYAAKNADPEILRQFLRHGGDANAHDRINESLLMVAHTAGRWENVKVLVEAGADVNALDQNISPHSILFFYADEYDKAFWLLQHGADPTPRVKEAANPAMVGSQPIVDAIFKRHIDETKFPDLAQWQKKCQQLLRERGIAPASG